ncbi:MAG: YARHG domain-containing protein [Anaerovoracaceae bacterium]
MNNNGIYCPYCGTKNFPNAEFCAGCGKKIGPAQPSYEQHQERKKKKIWIPVVIVCAAVIAALAFVYVHSFKPITVDLTSNLTASNLSPYGSNGDGEVFIDAPDARQTVDYIRGNARVEKLMDTVYYSVYPASGLKNGDTVEVKAKYSKETADKNHIIVKGDTKKIRVSGFEETAKEREGTHYYYNDSYSGSDYYILPNSDTEYLDEDDLAGLSSRELTLARNEIYARHGYKFSTDWIYNYFAGQDWYIPTYSKDEFNENWLSSIEARNVQFILAHE